MKVKKKKKTNETAEIIRRQDAVRTRKRSERTRESSRKGVLEMVQDGNYAVEAVDLGREEHERLERGR